jgi:DNA-binding FadR family transcriptional regulator
VASHIILAEIPRNPIFTAINIALSEWLMEQRTVSIRLLFAARRAYEGHEKIYLSIESRDVEQADRIVMEHLKTVAEYYSKGMAAKAK